MNTLVHNRMANSQHQNKCYENQRLSVKLINGFSKGFGAQLKLDENPARHQTTIKNRPHSGREVDRQRDEM